MPSRSTARHYDTYSGPVQTSRGSCRRWVGLKRVLQNMGGAGEGAAEGEWGWGGCDGRCVGLAEVLQKVGAAVDGGWVHF